MKKRKVHQELQVDKNGVVSVTDIAAPDTMPDCENPLCDRKAMPSKKGSRDPKKAYGLNRCAVCNQMIIIAFQHLRKIGEDVSIDAVAKYLKINEDKMSVFDLAEGTNSLTEFVE